MTTSDGGLERLVADFAEQHKKMVRTQAELTDATATATSRRNILTVTLGAGGRLQEVRFNNRDYRAMGPEDLAELVRKTFEEAHGALAKKVQEAVAPLAGGDPTLGGMLDGTFDWQDVFPASLFEQLGGQAPPTDRSRG